MEVCHVISSIGSTCSRNFMCICFTAAPTSCILVPVVRITVITDKLL